MGTKSRAAIYDGSVRAAAERARKEADRLACEAWDKRVLGFQASAQGLPGDQGRDRHAGALGKDEKLDSDRHQERLEEDFLVRVEEQNR
ncbi:hypothetical protein [Bradyrhizobium sp. th.b2]|uniref:hypothetical protein n=1 Tax=Bradyrhizobium sp. th-b2 TaxID=172088 RepID=UPI000401167C|nr:hypothetical protein [Bradyrhizobium sp. th.b2]